MELVFRPWIFLSFCLLIIIIIPKATSDLRFLQYYCSYPATFPTNNTYNSTLNNLLQALSSNSTANPTGYYSTSVYDNTIQNTFNSYFLCRGDIDNGACHTCILNAVTNKSDCPLSVRETIYYDKCLIRYSNETLHGVLASGPEHYEGNNGDLPGNRDDLEKLLLNMLPDLVLRAAHNGAGKKFATASVNFTAMITLYALVQCTPDLSADDCRICLTTAIGKLQVKLGENYLTPSCNLRYETYPFFSGPAYLQLSPPSPLSDMDSSGKMNISTGSFIGIVAAAAVIAAILPTIGMYVINKKAEKYRTISMQQGEEDTTVDSLRYDLALLQSATNNFSNENKLGEGGFGTVYKGELLNGESVAVKRLSRSANQGEEEFNNEVLLVAKLQHRNLVRLLGFCLTKEEKLLVYEFVPNKSLDKVLFDYEKRRHLDWKRRYNIIEGIARGMLYLHEDSRLKIIHRDLKASNVLLDADLNAKVSDFGTARIFGCDQTQGCTNRVVGTVGYMAPEYILNGQFSVRTDVYSFGILVLEIISGKKNSDFHEGDGEPNLISFAWKHRRDGTHLDFVDPCIRDQCSAEEVIRCINLGLLCVQDADQRPFMSTTVLMLSSLSATIPIAKKPTLFVSGNTTTALMKETNLSRDNSKLQIPADDISVTLPR